jgi:hypothetical protein
VSSQTTPITDPPAPAAPRPGAAGPDASGFAAELARSEKPTGIDITRSGPPPEVLDQMAQADAINARLREQGYELSFSLSADGCSLAIELRDTTGKVLRTLTAAEAAEIASGKSID